MNTLRVLLYACGLLGLPGQVLWSQLSYNVVPILPPGEGDWRNGGGIGINDGGEVVGTYTLFEDPSGYRQTPRAYLYSDSFGTIELPWPKGAISIPVGINSQGQIALYGRDWQAPFQAYRYSPGLGYESLGSFGGSETEAAAINNRGQVTGFSEGPDGHEHAYRFTDGVGMENIAPGVSSSRGFGINDRGWVVGTGDRNAFLFRDDLGLIDLGPGRAYGINNAGMVVGQTWIVPGVETAFIYKDGDMRILADDVFNWSVLNDVNGQEVAVGVGITPANVLRPVLWTEAGGLVDLNTLIPADSGWTLITAEAINESGQIVGSGTLDGRLMAFRLDPVPEPSAWALFGLGGLLLWRLRRRLRPKRIAARAAPTTL